MPVLRRGPCLPQTDRVHAVLPLLRQIDGNMSAPYPLNRVWCQLCGNTSMTVSNARFVTVYRDRIDICHECVVGTNQEVEVDESGIRAKQWVLKRS